MLLILLELIVFIFVDPIYYSDVQILYTKYEFFSQRWKLKSPDEDICQNLVELVDGNIVQPNSGNN